MNLFLQAPKTKLEGRLQGIRSKSISNRLLIMSALSGTPIDPKRLSKASDTRELYRALEHPSDTHELEGGTSFRFLLAYRFAINRPVTLFPKGSMQGRPIAPLVRTLTTLGGQFEYLKSKGCPPVRFNGRSTSITRDEVNVDCRISSQFASALALIAPYLDRSISLQLTDPVTSRSYLELSVKTMQEQGADVEMNKDRIRCRPSRYTLNNPCAEGDWSGASFFYALSGLYPSVDLFIPYLKRKSLQPDQILVDWFKNWGVETKFEKAGIRLRSLPNSPYPGKIELDFSENPDLAIPLIIFSALKHIPFQCSGLHSLPHKESNRLEVLQQTLQTLEARLKPMENDVYELDAKPYGDYSNQSFSPASDHRIAMGLSLLSTRYPICIEDAEVVEKSYPHFWKELEYIGFEIRNC